MGGLTARAYPVCIPSVNTKQHEILAAALRVDPSEVRWRFISDYYDGPISGLAQFHGRIFRFCCFPEDIPEQHLFVLHEISQEELAEELRVKAKFEELVGTHWSFDSEGKPLPQVARSEELSKRFYEEEKPPRNHEPRERPLVAWFDLAATAQ